MRRISKFKKGLSFKLKIILGFLIVVFLIGSTSIFTYVSLKDSIDKLNTMIETTIIANTIVTPTQEIHQAIKKYYIFKDNAAKEKMFADIAFVKNQLTILQERITDEDGITALLSLEGLIETYNENVIAALESVEKNEEEEYIIAREEIKDSALFIKDVVNELIATELRLQHELKATEDEKLRFIGLIILGSIILTGLLSILGAVIFSSRIAGAIGKLVQFSRTIASGNLQVQAVEIKTKDETAVLANSFSKMVSNLRELIGKIIENSTKINTSTDSLKTNAEYNSRASDQIALTMQELARGASEQAEESQKTVQVVTDLLVVNDNVSQSSTQVLTVAENALQAAEGGHEKILRILHQIKNIEKEIYSIQIAANVLEKKSHEINRILEVINHIFEQIDLLSVNASLEAARAGEYGKGFAVVADKISRLSHESAEAVKNISDILTEIRNESIQVSHRTLAGVDEVSQGNKVAAEAQIAFEKIVATSKETDFGVKNITKDLEMMTFKLNKVVEMNQNIAAIAEESSAGSQEVTAASQEQTVSMKEILQAAALLSSMAEELQKMTKRFTI